MTPDIFPDSVESKCLSCGHIWRYNRHEALACPYCNACFESVEFTGNKSMAWFTGRRWKSILKERRAAEQKVLPDRITKGLHQDWRQ